MSEKVKESEWEKEEQKSSKKPIARDSIIDSVWKILLYWELQNKEDGKLRGDRRAFIRALLWSHLPLVGIVITALAHIKVNELAPKYGQVVDGVQKAIDDLWTDAKQLRASIYNIFLNGAISYYFWSYVVNLVIWEQSSSSWSLAVGIINFFQALHVEFIANADHKATVASIAQNLLKTDDVRIEWKGFRVEE